MKKYKYHILTFILIIVIAGISGYFAFKIPDVVDVQVIENVENDINDKIVEDVINVEIVQTIENFKNDKIGDHEPKIKTTEDNNVKVEQPIDKFESNCNNETCVKLIVNNSEYNFEITKDITVYELMQNLSASSIKPFRFSGQEYTGLGFFVNEINGIKNDPQAGKYWIYYINGESAKVGISHQQINSQDIIEWKYDSTNF